jgi:EpsI family protein
MTTVTLWTAAGVLGIGALVTVGIDTQRVLPLRQPLDASVPRLIAGHVGRDVEISASEQAVAGMTDYLMRNYSLPERADSGGYDYSVYVGYYASQRQGRTIHSPKNCLPGAGWEALQNTMHTVELSSGGQAVVNRYLLRRGDQAALVLYWYQGRGRIEASEYRVKLDLLTDAVLRQRSDEALVRVVVPVTTTEDAAIELAARVAGEVAPAVWRSLPDGAP